MPTTEELLSQVVQLLGRSSLQLVDQFVADAEHHNRGKIREYTCPGDGSLDIKLRATSVKIFCPGMTLHKLKALSGVLGYIYVNGSDVPLMWPQQPDALASTEQHTTGYGDYMRVMATIKGPIYHLRVVSRIASSAYPIKVHVSDIIDYSEMYEILGDSQQSYLKFIKDAAEATQAALEAGGATEDPIVSIKDDIATLLLIWQDVHDAANDCLRTDEIT